MKYLTLLGCKLSKYCFWLCLPCSWLTTDDITIKHKLVMKSYFFCYYKTSVYLCVWYLCTCWNECMHVFRHVNQIANSYVFLSRKRMDILLTSASETCNLRIPPERISTAETFGIIQINYPLIWTVVFTNLESIINQFRIQTNPQKILHFYKVNIIFRDQVLTKAKKPRSMYHPLIEDIASSKRLRLITFPAQLETKIQKQ